MIRDTIYTVDLKDINEAKKFIPTADRTVINRPVKSFFYDPWELKDEYKGTIWEKIYNTLPTQKGEARIITLEQGTNYYSHADIDDRWHLNIQGNQSYLIDLDNKVMHSVEEDGIWYDMDAGRLHVAANFGCIPRSQLVVRQLLTRNTLKNPVKVIITITVDKIETETRYRFDYKLSPWLNRANKKGLITNFNYNKSNCVEFEVERDLSGKVLEMLPDPDFDISIISI